jgi:hypothetical protein
MMNQMFSKIKQIADAAGTIACLAICGVLVYGMVTQRALTSRPPDVHAGLRVGDKVAPLANFDYHQHDKSVLLFLDSTCVHCIASLPTYKRLYDKVRERPGSAVAIVGFFPSGNQINEFRKRGFELPAKSVSFASFQVRGTPTVILINKEGTIENFWIGELPPDAEQRLTQLIESTT